MAAVPPGLPPSEIDVDDDVVRELLRSQHPDLAALPLRFAAIGWDNVTYRLGDDLAVRLPRLRAAADLLRQEQRWLPHLAPALPVPIPVPVRTGAPSAARPWPWSVVPWTHGRTADLDPLPAGAAGDLGRFLAALHGLPVPPDAPRNDWRGVPLADRSGAVAELLDALRPAGPSLRPLLAAARDCWDRGLAAPAETHEAWVHGDLHPRNVVVADGRIAAVLDWGDLTVGDRATDLASAWMLVPPDARPAVWKAYGPVPAATHARARAWAVHFGLSFLAAGAGDPAWVEVGRRTLERACAPGEGDEG